VDIVEQTWAELGYRVRPLRYWAFVRTEQPHRRTEGGIWLSPKEQTFYGGMPHRRIIKATVCAVGPTVVEVAVGDRVCFQRLHFSKRERMADGTYFGWVDSNQLLGYPEDDEDEERWLQGEPAPIAPEVAAEYVL